VATKGGSAGSIGYDYQTWFIACKLVDVFFDENTQLQPEALIVNKQIINANNLSTSNIIKKAIVDDVIVYRNNIPTYFNIKYIAPSVNKWSVSALHSQGVLKQIVAQFKENGKEKIIFVSQSPCNLIENIFDRIKKSPNAKGIKLLLRSKQNENEYKLFKKYTGLTDNQTLKLSKIVEFERGYDTEDYKKLILRNFKNEVLNKDGVANSLYQLAKEACNHNKLVSKSDIIEWLEIDKIFGKSILFPSQIIKKFKSISSILINWADTFGNLDGTHIERNETLQILEWIKKPLNNKEKQILLFVGNAGNGKTVILKDVLKNLQNEDIPVVGLKADFYAASDYAELKSQLNIEEDFEKLLSTLAAKGETVLLIDQIDALSQTLSSKRDSVNFYYKLINRLSFIPNLRIIISCRIYDLNFDPILQQFEREEKITLGNLEKEQIEFVLRKMGLEIKDLPKSLLEILGNTQNLNIFCSIYDEELRLDELHTLQDLYGELWTRKITNRQSYKYDLIGLLTEISDEMYRIQKLSLARNYFEDKYSTQLRYLISEGILINEKKSIQFFHQSFFDYCFARIFVHSDKNLYEHSVSRHQGLFVRSQIKQVMSYLRGTNQRDYLIQLENFLKSTKVRHHIKLMIINQLGFEEMPLTQEWSLVKKYIFRNRLLTRHFLESTHNSKWLEKLNGERLVEKYLNDEKLVNSCASMLYKIIEIDPKTVLNLIVDIPDFKDQSKIISNLLFRLKDWSDDNAIKLFDKIESTYDGDRDFYIGHILNNAMNAQLDWTVKYLSKYMKKRIHGYVSTDRLQRNELFDHGIEEVFEKLYKKYPDLFFQTAFPIIKELAYKTKLKFETKFFMDNAFHLHEQMESFYSHWRLYDWLIEYIKEIALNNEFDFRKLVKKLKSEHSISIINLFISGLSTNHSLYKNEIYKLLSREHFLSDFSIDIGLSYNVSELIKNTYEYFTQQQKERLNKIIMTSKPEKIISKEDRRYKGASIYRLLNAIPNQERVKFSEIQKKYLELGRKFGEIKEEKPKKSLGGSVGPPLPQNAYEKMTFDQWLVSFKEYDDKTDWGARFNNKRGFNFGGLVEHSRMFGVKVKEEPEKFYPFLLKIVNEEIASNYTAEGLTGLIDAHYLPEKVSELLKELYKTKEDEIIKNRIIKGIEYLDIRNYLDNEVIDIICDYAVNDSDPEQETWKINAENNTPYYGGDPLTAGLNTIRGSAAFTIVKFRNVYSYQEKIFETLEQIAKDKSIAVKCSAIANLNVLIHIDEERVFKIFLKLTKDLNKEVLRNGLSTLSYYIQKKYSSLKNHIEQALQINGNHGYQNVQHFMGQLLMYLYVSGVRGSRYLFEKALKNSDERKAGALHYSVSHLTSSRVSIRKKARTIFKELIQYNNQSIQNEYWRAFKEFNSSDFNELFDLIVAYSQVKGQKRREKDSFYEYLLLCVND